MKKHKSLIGMKGLELQGGYSFVKMSKKRKTKPHKNKGKTWSWD